MSIDAKALAEAWANVMDGRRIGTGFNAARIGRDTTTPEDWRAILAEYARLVPAEDEGRLPCPDCQNIDGHSFDCPTGSQRGKAEDEGRALAVSMARAMTDSDYEPCGHGQEYQRRGLCTHPDHDPKPVEDEGRLREAARTCVCIEGGREGHPWGFGDCANALAATPEPRVVGDSIDDLAEGEDPVAYWRLAEVEPYPASRVIIDIGGGDYTVWNDLAHAARYLRALGEEPHDVPPAPGPYREAVTADGGKFVDMPMGITQWIDPVTRTTETGPEPRLVGNEQSLEPSQRFAEEPE